MSQKKYSLLYPDTNAQYRTLSDVTMHDLGMDQICKKLSAKEREQNYIQNVMARMYADPAVTQYRCDIFEDVLQQKKMRDDLMEILERISFLRDYGSFNREYDESACIWDLLHRLDELFLSVRIFNNGFLDNRGDTALFKRLFIFVQDDFPLAKPSLRDAESHDYKAYKRCRLHIVHRDTAGRTHLIQSHPNDAK